METLPDEKAANFLQQGGNRLDSCNDGQSQSTIIRLHEQQCIMICEGFAHYFFQLHQPVISPTGLGWTKKR